MKKLIFLCYLLFTPIITMNVQPDNSIVTGSISQKKHAASSAKQPEKLILYDGGPACHSGFGSLNVKSCFCFM
ncbi:MAG: hypothetical protein MUC93_02910 [Bacteroidales bacterium]|jgi:hypothetical protein|nr:hypothetical protein [Bacteroidales bacterium]